jgi:hypothetical protein
MKIININYFGRLYIQRETMQNNSGFRISHRSYKKFNYLGHSAV